MHALRPLESPDIVHSSSCTLEGRGSVQIGRRTTTSQATKRGSAVSASALNLASASTADAIAQKALRRIMSWKQVKGDACFILSRKSRSCPRSRELFRWAHSYVTNMGVGRIFSRRGSMVDFSGGSSQKLFPGGGGKSDVISIFPLETQNTTFFAENITGTCQIFKI